MKVQEPYLGSGGATTGPWGAVSETLSIGLGLSISLDPAFGDLLAEPKSRRRGLNSLKTSIISLIFSKAEFIRPALKDTVAGGGGGLKLVETEPLLHYQHVEYSVNLLDLN